MTAGRTTRKEAHEEEASGGSDRRKKTVKGSGCLGGNLVKKGEKKCGEKMEKKKTKKV